MIRKRKSYAVEELMSGQWHERFGGFKSLGEVRKFAKKYDGAGYGRLRIVRVLREPVPYPALNK